MGTADTSMYQKPDNPLATMTGTVGLAHGLTEQNLLSMKLQGQQGLANLYAQAPKDDNGDPDLNYIVKNSSQAGIGAPEAMAHALLLQKQKYDVASSLAQSSEAQLALKKNLNQTITSSTVPLLTEIDSDMQLGKTDPDAFEKKYRGKVADAYSDVIANSIDSDGKPIVTPQMAVSHLSSINFRDPVAVKQELLNQLSRAQAMSGHIDDALDIKRGKLGSAPVGLGTQPTTTSMFTGAVAPTGAVVPTGTSFAGGRSQLNANLVSSNNPFSPQNPSNPNNQGTAQQSVAQPSGQVPAATAQGTAVPSPNTAPAPSAYQHAMAGALPEAPPSFHENLTEGLKRANQTIENANATRPLQTPLKGILSLIDSAHPGPNAELYNKAKGAFADSPISGLFNPSKSAQDDVAKYEILQKYAGDVVGQNMGVNASTDLGRSVQQLSNPSAAQFPLALRTVTKYLLGRTAAANAQGNYMSDVIKNPNVAPPDILNAEKDFRDHYDQNLYEVPYMNADEKKNLWATMGGPNSAEGKKFIKNGMWAEKKGLVNADDIE